MTAVQGTKNQWHSSRLYLMKDVPETLTMSCLHWTKFHIRVGSNGISTIIGPLVSDLRALVNILFPKQKVLSKEVPDNMEL